MPLFQNEATSKTFHMKMSLIHDVENEHVAETHFHMNGFAPRLVLAESP